MSFLSPPLLLALTTDEIQLIRRPINGKGGVQGCLRALQACWVKPNTMLVDVALLDRAYHYAYAYGQGGFEDRFRAVVGAACRAGWVPPDPKPAIRRGGAFGRP